MTYYLNQVLTALFTAAVALQLGDALVLIVQFILKGRGK
jgi:hypothetical protein